MKPYDRLVTRLAVVTIVIDFSGAHHPAGKPCATGGSDKERDTGLACASKRKAPEVAFEPGIALGAKSPEWSIHQRGVPRVQHTRGVADEGTLDARDAVRRPDGVASGKH